MAELVTREEAERWGYRSTVPKPEEWLRARETIMALHERADGLILTVRSQAQRLKALEEPARELLTLYDWRFELAKMELHPNTDPKEMRRLLGEYGRRKKAGWVALRAALNLTPEPDTPASQEADE